LHASASKIEFANHILLTTPRRKALTEVYNPEETHYQFQLYNLLLSSRLEKYLEINELIMIAARY